MYMFRFKRLFDFKDIDTKLGVYYSPGVKKTGNHHDCCHLMISWLVAAIGKPTPNIKNIQSLYDLDLWRTTLTYITTLAKVKVDLHAKDEGR